MRIVIDTNIIFSGLLNSSGKIGDLLFNSHKIFQFYSCEYMRFEIEKHRNKLLRISNLTPKQLDESTYQLFKKIMFINESLIPEKTWLQAEKLVGDFDIDDTDFVALTKHLKGHLWTGDKILYNGLKKLAFKNVISTSELFTLRETKLEK